MLLNLPVELLANVVEHLEWKDYGACRLTCRGVEAVMYPSFARNSFTHCRVMRTPESIQALINISKSRLGPFVKRLGVSTEVLRSTENSSRDLQPSGSPQKTNLTVGQDAFISTGCDREMLTEALLKLQSIQSIQIRNVYSNPSYSMSTAPRHPSGKQRSLGLRRILLKQEETIEVGTSRERPTVAADDHSERACLYSTLLALGRAGTRPEELEVTNNVGFDCKAFHIPACIAGSVIPVLGQLEVLLLSISPGTSVGPVRGPSLPGVRPQNITTHDVRIFLQYMPRLRTLRLRFNGLENRHDGFTEWLASAPSGATQDTLPQSPPAIAFSCLQGLFLQYILGIHVQDLISVVRKLAPTLQNLKFNWVHLETSLHGHTSAPSAPGSVWTEFLHSLKIELSNELRWLCLSEVMDTEHTDLTHNTLRVSRDVIFAKGQKHYQACSYSGPAMRQALEAMIHYIEGDSSWVSSTWEGNWRFYHDKSVVQDCQPSASV